MANLRTQNDVAQYRKTFLLNLERSALAVEEGHKAGDYEQMTGMKACIQRDRVTSTAHTVTGRAISYTVVDGNVLRN
jgi:hypothetical protein